MKLSKASERLILAAIVFEVGLLVFGLVMTWRNR